MAEFDITKKSRPVVVTAYQTRWADEFQQLAIRIRALVGAAALRIDHIGSTAVTGLAAKDLIDVQITVANLDQCAELTASLHAAAFGKAASSDSISSIHCPKRAPSCASST